MYPINFAKYGAKKRSVTHAHRKFINAKERRVSRPIHGISTSTSNSLKYAGGFKVNRVVNAIRTMIKLIRGTKLIESTIFPN
jgi:hypothetical protein